MLSSCMALTLTVPVRTPSILLKCRFCKSEVGREVLISQMLLGSVALAG